MDLPADSVAKSQAGRIVILLGAQGAGKTDALLTLSGSAALSAVDDRLTALVGDAKSIGFCSTQGLFPSRLAVRETIRLMAALHGLDESTSRDRLLQVSALNESADQSTYILPRQPGRLLNLVLALWPDPDVLLIDDVTRGLSLPAQRQLCRFILEEQQRRPRTILFATRDLHVAQTLGGEVWLFDRGQILHHWQPDELPAQIFQSSAYEIDLKSPTAAHSLRDALMAQPKYVRDAQLLGTTMVRVIVDRTDQLLNVMQIAGRDLLDFRARPLEADYLLTQWPASRTASSTATRETVEFEPATRLSHKRSRSLTWRQCWRGTWHLARAEWRTHFRRGWRAGNILFSSLLVLMVMQVMLQRFELNQLTSWVPFVLLLLSSLILGLAGESIHRLTQVAESETLFQSARPLQATSRFSLLALYDQTPIGRTSVLLGVAAGQLGILLAHSIIPLVAWGIIVAYAGQGWPVLIAGVAYWWLTAVNSLAITVLISGLVRRPGWNVWLGWLLWPSISLTGLLGGNNQPLMWLWPYIGLIAAFQHLSTAPAVALVAFGLALLGTTALCILALRSFKRRPAIYRES